MSAPSLCDNLAAQPGHLLARRLQGAGQLDICTDTVGGPGLRPLADWLDRMDPEASARLLVGMAPEGWNDLGAATSKSAAAFLCRHLDNDAADLPGTLARLERHCVAGRLAVKALGGTRELAVYDRGRPHQAPASVSCI